MNLWGLKMNDIAKPMLDPKIQESLVLRGDLSGLNVEQKKEYYLFRCKQVGLDPATKPFDLLTLNGKEVLYANASATQQLCSLHRLSTQITHRESMDDIYIVSVRVTGADGRISENQGAVSVAGLAGEKLANAILKATTKAVRRSVLAHIGLGMLDETEVETIPDARRAAVDITPPPPVQIEEVKPIEVNDWKVWAPGASEPYSSWKTPGSWVKGMNDMFDRIVQSQKLNPEAKLETFKKSLNVNAATAERLPTNEFENYDQLIRRVQGGLTKHFNSQEH